MTERGGAAIRGTGEHPIDTRGACDDRGMRNVLLVGGLMLTACSKSEPPTPVEADPIVERCIAWGVSHYKTIGAYPTLTNGTPAKDEARARCKESIRSFPDPQIAEIESEIAKLDEIGKGVMNRMDAATNESDRMNAKLELQRLMEEQKVLFDKRDKIRAESR